MRADPRVMHLLTTALRLSLGGDYLLTARGSGAGGLVDIDGVPLVGTNSGGKSGSDSVAVLHGFGSVTR